MKQWMNEGLKLQPRTVGGTARQILKMCDGLCLCRYWGGLVPESCRQAHVGEEWNCFFGYKVYPTLKSESPHTPSLSARQKMMRHLKSDPRNVLSTLQARCSWRSGSSTRPSWRSITSTWPDSPSTRASGGTSRNWGRSWGWRFVTYRKEEKRSYTLTDMIRLQFFWHSALSDWQGDVCTGMPVSWAHHESVSKNQTIDR